MKQFLTIFIVFAAGVIFQAYLHLPLGFISQEEVPLKYKTEIITKEVEVSVLAEQKRCAEWGGMHGEKGHFFVTEDRAWCVMSYTEGNKYITETLFDYKFPSNEFKTSYGL